MDLRNKILSRIKQCEGLAEEAEKNMEHFSYSPELISYYEGKAQAYRYAIVDFRELLELVGGTND